MTARSMTIFEESQRAFPGGVNSPVRAFGAVGGDPVVIASGAGPRVVDVDGRGFIDYVGSWGAAILGHADKDVVDAIGTAASRGTSFGMPTPYELELARLIRAALPSLELMRFVSSGTEAAMSALRVARGFTKRERILKFGGCYHGHADPLLAQAGSGIATLGLPSSAGVPQAAVADTLVAAYNDLDAVERIFEAHRGQIAAVIVEPVAANMGVVAPRPGFLQGLRDLTRRDGALLIFDEVITGFRVAWNGAQGRAGVIPDLTCLGKIIGGGLPVGAYGGRREIMEMIAPLGPVYQAGTLSGNPVAMAAGAATLRRLSSGDLYRVLDARAARLADGLAEAASSAKTPVAVVRDASMLTVFFDGAAPSNFAEAGGADTAGFSRFFRAMVREGVLLPPSQFEAWFVSAAHGDAEIEATVRAAERAFAASARSS